MDLETPISELSFVGPIYEKRIEKLGINTVGELLHHPPSRYIDFSVNSDINRLRVGETVTIHGKVDSIINQYAKSGRKIQIAQISDETGNIMAVWFNQPFLVRILYPGVKVALAGEVTWFGRKLAFISPEFEKIIPEKETVSTGRIIPVYPETAGISSKWIRGRMKEALEKTRVELKEFLPKELLQRQAFPEFETAISNVHFPKNLEDAVKGKKRLAFNELLFLHLASLERKAMWEKNIATHNLSVSKDFVNEFVSSLPFALTLSQEKAAKEILIDISGKIPMNRLLEGDVGSGKTVVAALGAFIAFKNGFKTLIMAPTQILAEQHFQTLNSLFLPFKIKVGIITSERKKERGFLPDILVGTHALIASKENFVDVALVVIDEQHRFGVEQRTHLVKKSKSGKVAPHVLTMTATPIPRTVALTFYGDLELSTLTELPRGRKKITTWIVPPEKRDGAYAWIRQQIINNNSQVFVVCPLIEESSVETMKQVRAVTKEYESLKKIYKNQKVGLLHGRLSANKKNEVLNKFRLGHTDILVSTPVIEVGIDVPKATIMLIEASERFGLAQLHQLRGRVGRSDAKSYCLLFSEDPSEKALKRLTALTKAKSGFELAELDLAQRGPGEIFGTKQHGFPELKIASWSDIELIKNSKSVAESAYKSPRKYKKLLQKFHGLLDNKRSLS